MRTAAVFLLALLMLPARAAETPASERIALIAGASSGGPSRVTLRYASSDAREVARVLEQLGGVREEDLLLLEEPDADALRRAIAQAGKRAGEIRDAGRRPELFVYYSGHSDEDGLLLGSTRLSYAQLRQDLDRVPAEVRVAILDSCASGAFTRVKGGLMRPAFQVDTSSHVRGHAFLTSSAADEASQESDRLRASFFTHALVTGLRGAADATGDGMVTLNEAYQFAFHETLARTEATRSGPQHATYDIALAGSGEVIITDLRHAGAVLSLPSAMGGKVFVRNTAGALVAELRKVAGSPVDLAVDPGDYRIRVAREGKVEQLRLSIAAAQRVVLPEARLEPVTLEKTAARGASIDADGFDVPQAAFPMKPGGRHVVFVTLGGVTLRGDRGTFGGEEFRSSGKAGLLFELGYRHWFTERLAIESAMVARGLQGQEREIGNTKTSSASTVLGLTLGVKYAHPLTRRHDLFLGGSIAAGAYYGMAGKSTETVDGEEKDESDSEGWVPGARLRAALDYHPTSHLVLGFETGYSQLGKFREFVGPRRNYSGFEAGLSIGYGWGR